MLIELEKVYGELRSAAILLLVHEINKYRDVASVYRWFDVRPI
jgi:hypothetical protein